ncbi:unnamed protein product, partial [Cyprideis torosa]
QKCTVCQSSNSRDFDIPSRFLLPELQRFVGFKLSTIGCGRDGLCLILRFGRSHHSSCFRSTTRIVLCSRIRDRQLVTTR